MRTIMGGTTPICITYRRSSERPVIKQKRRFVGFRQLVKNAFHLIADTFDSIAFETEEKLELSDDTVAVHWALEVDDPWGSDRESTLVAVRVPECPPAGQHFEIFKIDPSLGKKEPQKRRLDPADEVPTVARRANGVPQDEIREKLRAAIMNQGLYDPEAGPTEL